MGTVAVRHRLHDHRQPVRLRLCAARPLRRWQEINDRGIVGAPLGDIGRDNEIMRTQDRETFTEMVAASNQSEKPPNFDTIVAINRGLETFTPKRATKLEIGPNRSAVHHRSPSMTQSNGGMRDGLGDRNTWAFMPHADN